MVLRMLLQNDLTGFNFNSNLSAIDMFANSGLDHTDLPRMREGRLQGQVPLLKHNLQKIYLHTIQYT